MKTVIHLIYRFDIGGLEKVMADTINKLPEFNHVIVTLTYTSAGSRNLLETPIEIIELNKKEGNDLSVWYRLARLFYSYQPDILQTYNLPTIEYQFLAFLMRIPLRVHAEHGRDASDPNGSNPKYMILRKLMNLFIHCWIPVSDDLKRWLVQDININTNKIELIRNGIDTEAYYRLPVKKRDILEGAASNRSLVIGTIGRLDPVKNQKALINAFYHITQAEDCNNKELSLIIVGDGPLKHDLREHIEKLSLHDKIWLPGALYNIVELLSAIDIFVLPSIAEGIPITVLEAMSTETPVIASRVGGLPEIINSECGVLIKPGDQAELNEAIQRLVDSPDQRKQLGLNARSRVVEHFSLNNMINLYRRVYQGAPKCAV